MTLETIDSIVTNAIVWIPVITYVAGMLYLLWKEY